MNVSIVAVGTELLFGQTVNTNATYISKHLNLMGFNVMYHHVVGDNPERLKEMLGEVFNKVDLIILTGGLGPTQDDLTKETVAEFMGAKMYTDESIVKELEDFFVERGRTMSPNNMKQAYLPVGCTPFHNAAGTAPGFALEKNGKCAICLPGPPREMKYLFDNFVIDYVSQFLDHKMYYRVIRTIGIGESDLEDKLLPLIDGQTDPTLATYAKEGECTLRVASMRKTLEEAKTAVNEMIKKVDELIGEYIFSYDNEELSEVIVKQMTARGLTLACAESCTGGMFASCITDVPGASNVLKHGFVVYSAEAKILDLGVDSLTIESKGVVSPETALEMAEKLQKLSGADLAISITGIAGPDACEGRLSGEAFIGYSYNGNNGVVVVYTGSSDRKWNRNYFRLNMLRTVYQLINGQMK